MVDIYKFEEELNRGLLKELEKRFQNNEIDKETYQQLKERYEKKLADAKKGIETGDYPVALKVSGSQTMTEDTLKYSGSTHLKGGKINKNIKFAGSGRVVGDLQCMNLKCSGSFKSNGSLLLNGNLHSSGSFHTEGGIKTAGNVKFSASSTIGDYLIVGGTLRSSGSFECKSFLKTGSDINLSGTSIITGSIESKGLFHCSGSLTCLKHLIASMGIHLSGGSEIGEDMISTKEITITGKLRLKGNIKGYDISLNYFDKLLERFVPKRKKSIVEKSIMGLNHVEIDNSIIKGDIEGYDIIIGPNTTIEGQIYYVNEIEIDRKAQISSDPIKIEESELIQRANSSNENPN